MEIENKDITLWVLSIGKQFFTIEFEIETLTIIDLVKGAHLSAAYSSHSNPQPRPNFDWIGWEELASLYLSCEPLRCSDFSTYSCGAWWVGCQRSDLLGTKQWKTFEWNPEASNLNELLVGRMVWNCTPFVCSNKQYVCHWNTYTNWSSQ